MIFKKMLALILALSMVLSLAMPTFAAEAGVPVPTTATVTALDGNDVTTSSGSFELTVLYTNDIHTHIDGDLSYATIYAVKQDMELSGKNVLLADAGDHIQGTAYGAMDEGKTIVKLMNAAGYDVATLGNHEFDYGMERALEVSTSGEANYSYVSCNFYDLENGNKPVLDAYKMFTVDGKKVAFVGVTTPETYTKSTPAYFMDEKQENFIYSIAGDATGEALYTAVQTAVDDAKKDGADYVIALGHCGDDDSSKPWRSRDVIANTTGIDAFIDGHSHTEMPMEEVKDKNGDTVILTQTGNYYNAIGQMTIKGDTITATLLKAEDITVKENPSVKAIQDEWMDEVDSQLNVPIAETSINFYINDENGNRVVRKQETNLGNLDADAYYWYFNMKEDINCDVAFMNGGGIRADVPAKYWTYKDCKTVNPFGNILCLMEVTGQTILDALEWGAKDARASESGGFLHTAGLTYKVDESITSTVQADANKVWTGGPTGEYRVYDVKVYNKKTKAYEALDLKKKYTLAGINYTLRQMGDGFDMFKDATLVKDYVSEDYLALASYLKAFKDVNANGLGDIATANSPLSAYKNYLLNYENRNGSGRIVYEAKPATTSIEDAVIEQSKKVVYTGEEQQVPFTVTLNGKQLTEGKDYTVNTVNGKSVFTGAGKHKVTVTGTGDYTGKVSAYVYIDKASIAGAVVKQSKKVVYTGKEQQVPFTVTLNGKKLTEGKDYTVNTVNGKSVFTGVGKHKVTVIGTGNYTGKVSAYVTIDKAAQPLTVSPVAKSYTAATAKKKAQTFTLKVTKAQGAVTYKSSNTKYVTVSSKGKVTVKKGTPKGTYKVTVTAAGNKNYNKGSKTVTVTVK